MRSGQGHAIEDILPVSQVYEFWVKGWLKDFESIRDSTTVISGLPIGQDLDARPCNRQVGHVLTIDSKLRMCLLWVIGVKTYWKDTEPW